MSHPYEDLFGRQEGPGGRTSFRVRDRATRVPEGQQPGHLGNKRQQRGAIISQRSGIVDAAGIPVGQDVRGVGDVVEKFTGAPQVPG